MTGPGKGRSGGETHQAEPIKTAATLKTEQESK
ncbi:MAG: hypothetical protein JWP91_4092 [Fibrobacteres bacterium]|nr:hypothetical protein [Fibrobacterota bacterium]